MESTMLFLNDETSFRYNKGSTAHEPNTVHWVSFHQLKSAAEPVRKKKTKHSYTRSPFFKPLRTQYTFTVSLKLFTSWLSNSYSNSPQWLLKSSQVCFAANNQLNLKIQEVQQTTGYHILPDTFKWILHIKTNANYDKWNNYTEQDMKFQNKAEQSNMLVPWPKADLCFPHDAWGEARLEVSSRLQWGGLPTCSHSSRCLWLESRELLRIGIAPLCTPNM